MKKLLLSLTISAFALVPALQAGEAGTCAKTCADKAAAATAGATCASKATASAATCTGVKACDSKSKSARVLHSPRGSLMARR